MKKILIVTCFILISLVGLAQKIYVTTNYYEAQKIIFITNSIYNTDLKVYVTNNKYETKQNWNSGIWYFTSNKHEADFVVFFTTDRYDVKAIKIVYVKSKFSAGKPQ